MKTRDEVDGFFSVWCECYFFFFCCKQDFVLKHENCQLFAPQSVNLPLTMEDHRKRYYDLIDHSVSVVVNCENDPQRFDKHVSQLNAVVSTYGLKLEQFNLLLDQILDPYSGFKVGMKLKLVGLLYSRDLLDFDTLIKIVSVFKVPSYYNDKSKVKLVPRNIQLKLSVLLLRNFPNIQWDKKILRLANLLFNALSIGYLRMNIGLFLVYMLNIANEIDPKFNLKYFFSIKKLEILIEFYEIDSKSSLPLLLQAYNFLGSAARAGIFDMIFLKLKALLKDLKIPKDVFGKLDAQYTESLLKITNDRFSLTRNIDMFKSMLININIASMLHSVTNTKKRKYTEDITDNGIIQLASFKFIDMFCQSIPYSFPPNIIVVLQYFSNLEFSDYGNIMSENFNTTQLGAAFPIYEPLLTCLKEQDILFLNYSVRKLLDVKQDRFTLTDDMFWLFRSINNISQIFNEPFPLMVDICAGKLVADYKGTLDQKLKILQLHSHLQFLEPNCSKWSKVLTDVIDMTFRHNNTRNMTALTFLAFKWSKDPLEFNRFIRLIIRKFRFRNFSLLKGFLVLLTSFQKLLHKDIDAQSLVLPPHIMAMAFFSNDLFQLNILLHHVLFCKVYYATHGIEQIDKTNSKALRELKELHNSYIVHICQCLWKDKVYDREIFSIPLEFIAKLPTKKPFDLIGMDCIKASVGDVFGDTDRDTRINVLNKLRDLGCNGIYDFLYNSIRSLQT